MGCGPSGTAATSASTVTRAHLSTLVGPIVA